MILNLKFFIALTLLGCLLIAFVLMIFSTLAFSDVKEFVFHDTGNAVKAFKDIKDSDTVIIAKKGTLGSELSANTKYYRYSALTFNALAMITGLYMIYAN